ncbi:phosphatidylglycerol lysyltransferase domain-containing protein [Amycolatopsis sp. DSM 110486]|uniref:phosphatidylglycerol lysyltransferase domain-containing protein n=1 Tax=Amycolatopsis sp. DSM 110486 TaxID=2865832 RepID=UPI001C6A3E60|nr:phosphatidylglycerol lysyltransferase domain-containing protein [Amycolatopsis sp. DSM 110486]QYN24448.1 phosphatidylglycerol lysyltransferase domain-containing protein [Amycolatopsis sp. DSM 110486]
MVTGTRAQHSWQVAGVTTVKAITWVTRLAGLLTLLSVVVPSGRNLRGHLAEWLELPPGATVAAATVAVVTGVLLIMLAAGLRRRKRRAWQLAVGFAVLLTLSHLGLRHVFGAGVVSVVLLVGLIVNRRYFVAEPDPTTGRWRAVRVFLQLVLAGFVINVVLLSVASGRMLEPLSFPGRLSQSGLALVGVSGPAVFHGAWLEDLSAAIGLLFSIAAVLVSAYFLLRSAEPAPELSDDELARLQALLAEHGDRDSLGYFALRRDKFAVFSKTGKAAVTYRVIAGVALTSADPLGDHEAWPGAIEEYLEICKRNAWVPAAMGASELGATVWARFGLEVLEIGDEAIVDTAGFTLEGRIMRGVRQAASRTRRAGYKVLVRRAEDLRPGELDELVLLAAAWRGTETERGFSMALGRMGDPGAVIVTAEQGGRVRGVLQFVPWGARGLSLDVMRRDRSADNGVNELMISELLVYSHEHDIDHVSLNFAAFRSLMEQGQRIGAGPVARISAKVLHFFSRWIQIESLYRFNAKFQPRWVPRYLVYPGVRELPRVGVATFEAEGLGGRSPWLRRLLQR